MKRRRTKGRQSFSYKMVFVFVFVLVLAVAVMSESNTSGALFIKRAGVSDPSSFYINLCIDVDGDDANYKNIVSEAYIEQHIAGEIHVIKRQYDVCNSRRTLQEQFCWGSRIYGRTVYCSDGCENGACNPCLNCEEITASCKDSDGGKMFYVTGVVTDDTGGHIDTCNGNIIREGYCLDGKYAFEERTCLGDCMYGTCLKQN